LLAPNSSLRLDVLVVGPGGSGSTALIAHISKYFSCNSLIDLDGLKHLPSPPPRKIAAKIIFVSGNFEDVRKSLSRRNRVLHQTIKLRPSGMPAWHKKAWDLKHLVELQAKKFIEGPVVDTLYIHYEELFESAEIIANFLGAQRSFLETFPRRRERH
jgi:hypothetical protein